MSNSKIRYTSSIVFDNLYYIIGVNSTENYHFLSANSACPLYVTYRESCMCTVVHLLLYSDNILLFLSSSNINKLLHLNYSDERYSSIDTKKSSNIEIITKSIHWISQSTKKFCKIKFFLNAYNNNVQTISRHHGNG